MQRGSEKRELFSPTLLGKVEVGILKFGRPLHFLKSSVRWRKGSQHACASSPGGAKGPSISGSPLAGVWPPFAIFSFGFLALAPRLARARPPLVVSSFGYWPSSLQSPKRLRS